MDLNGSKPRVQLVVLYSPSCPHCVQFLRELDGFESELFRRAGPRVMSPVQRIDVTNRSVEPASSFLHSIPSFKTVPHVVRVAADQGKYIDELDHDEPRTAKSLASFAKSGKHGKRFNRRAKKKSVGGAAAANLLLTRRRHHHPLRGALTSRRRQ